MTKLLFAVTSADHWTLNDGTAHPTGYWAEELVEAHRVFVEAGYDIVIATPGGKAPLWMRKPGARGQRRARRR